MFTDFIRWCPWSGMAIKCRMEDLDHVLGKPVRLYDFRHSFATRKLKAGTESHTLATLMGRVEFKLTDEVGNKYHLDTDPEVWMIRRNGIWFPSQELRPGQKEQIHFAAARPLDKAKRLTLELRSIRQEDDRVFRFDLPITTEPVTAPDPLARTVRYDELKVLYRDPKAVEQIERYDRDRPRKK